jgi:hypothetical protein
MTIPLLVYPEQFHPSPSFTLSMTKKEQEAVDALRNREPWRYVPDAATARQQLEDPLGLLADRQFSDVSDEEEKEWNEYYRFFCDDACLKRFLRANEWSVDRAFQGLVATLGKYQLLITTYILSTLGRLLLTDYSYN